MLEFLADYIVVVVLGICLSVGYVIKHSFDNIPNKYIPLIIALLGVVLNVWVHQWAFSPEILLGGLASGLAATGAHQIVKQLKKGDE